jgi:class 3 adenylate cyclase/tetratricopeptide (TPR) repeat protein
LSERLDPEHYHGTMRTFQQACTEAVARHAGLVANFIGDCLVAYFGWPQSQEDDAERAVRAAHALIQALRALNEQRPGMPPIEVRAGVASGSVVIGDVVPLKPAHRQSAVGQAPLLAAQIEGAALPGQVLVDEQTMRLVAGTHAVRAVGRHSFPGLATSVDLYAVEGEHGGGSRFDDRRGRDLAPMVGRDQELALLKERWRLVQEGEGQVALVLGDAGMGKSRLVRALRDAIAGSAHWLVQWQCSAHHAGSALWPVIQQLRREAQLLPDDPPEVARGKLQAVAGATQEAQALYAGLLGVAGAQPQPHADLGPQMQRARTLEVLVEHLVSLATHKPLLLVVEDIHWIDPSTEELVERLVDALETARVFVLATCRQGHEPARAAYAGATRLTLSRLGRGGVEAIMARLGGQRLQADTVQRVVAQSDGVPLFVEELTKAVLETGEASIPVSLMSSLMARLDRVPEVREIAQVAACIGREFDRATLEAVAEHPATVAPALDRLVQAELVFAHGARAAGRFVFKHALVQEAAADSLLRSRRQAIHARILQVLEQRPDSLPEILAFHAAQSGAGEKALRLWQQAGEAAMLKSAFHEALTYFSNAIGLVPPHDKATEAVLQLRRGQAAMWALGQGAALTGEAFRRAEALLDASSGPALRLQARYGLWSWHFVRGHRTALLQVANDALSAAQAEGDQAALGIAQHMMAMAFTWSGELSAARQLLEQILDLLHTQNPYAKLAPLFGMNHEMSVCYFLGWTLGLLGRVEQGHEMLGRSREIATRLPQGSAKALMHLHCAIAGMATRDIGNVRADCEAFAQMAAQHKLPAYRGYADCIRGWLSLEGGLPAEEAAALLSRGIKDLDAFHSRCYRSFFVATLGRAWLAAGRREEAVQAVSCAIAEDLEDGAGWCGPELWRVHAELLWTGTPADQAEAICSAEHALSMSRMQQASTWELRTSLSLARRHAERGDRRSAAQVLAQALEPFAPDARTADVLEARALLDEWQRPPAGGAAVDQIANGSGPRCTL